MKNVVITGADGFVGSYTTEHFLKNGLNVLALDVGEKPLRLKESAGLTYMQCDISNTAAMLDKIPRGVYDTLSLFLIEFKVLSGI